MQINLSDLPSQIYPFMNLWGFNPIWPGLSRRKDSQNLISWIKESNFSRCWLGRGCSLRCPFCSNFFVELWVTKLRSKLLYREHRKATFFVRRRYPSRELHLVYSHSGAHKSVDSPIHYYFVLVKHSFMWTAILLSVTPSTVDKPDSIRKWRSTLNQRWKFTSQQDEAQQFRLQWRKMTWHRTKRCEIVSVYYLAQSKLLTKKMLF